MVDAVISSGEASRRLGLTKARISQLVSSGDLVGRMVGGRKMVTAESVSRYALLDRKSGPRAAEACDYVLMCADYEVALLSHSKTAERPFAVRGIFDQERMPLGTVTAGGNAKLREFNEWWEYRSVPDTRPGMMAYLADQGLGQSWQVPLRGLGLSLSDCYWIRPDKSAMSWESVNYFDNDFVGSSDGQWDRWLKNMGLDSPDNTSEGELPKRWVIRDGVRLLLKGGGFDDQRPFNEAVATCLHGRLLMAGEYVPYEVVSMADGPACSCPNFLGPREEFIPAAYVRRFARSVRGSSPYERFCRAAGMFGVGDEDMNRSMGRMIVCDALIANTDRHWRNFGFIRNVDTLAMRPAPLFDSGNSLWYAKSPGEVRLGDWSFAARPFGPEPERQLSLVRDVAWFDERALEGFVDEAVETLRGSSHATQPGRLDYIARGLLMRVHDVSVALRVLAFR